MHSLLHLYYRATTEIINMQYMYIYICSKVNTWNVNCAWATVLIFHSQPDVLVKVSKFKGDSNPQPSDSYVECYKHLSHHGLYIYIYIQYIYIIYIYSIYIYISLQCHIYSAPSTPPLELSFVCESQLWETNVLDSYQLAMLPQSERRELNPHIGHDNFLALLGLCAFPCVGVS